ncbi:hypothetical protein KCV05_g266, partial [Aureobasidium melanogenum]
MFTPWRLWSSVTADGPPKISLPERRPLPVAAGGEARLAFCAGAEDGLAVGFWLSCSQGCLVYRWNHRRRHECVMRLLCAHEVTLEVKQSKCGLVSSKGPRGRPCRSRWGCNYGLRFLTFHNLYRLCLLCTRSRRKRRLEFTNHVSESRLTVCTVGALTSLGSRGLRGFFSLAASAAAAFSAAFSAFSAAFLAFSAFSAATTSGSLLLRVCLTFLVGSCGAALALPFAVFAEVDKLRLRGRDTDGIRKPLRRRRHGRGAPGALVEGGTATEEGQAIQQEYRIGKCKLQNQKCKPAGAIASIGVISVSRRDLGVVKPLEAAREALATTKADDGLEFEIWTASSGASDDDVNQQPQIGEMWKGRKSQTYKKTTQQIEREERGRRKEERDRKCAMMGSKKLSVSPGFLRCWLREQVAENDQTNSPAKASYDLGMRGAKERAVTSPLGIYSLLIASLQSYLARLESPFELQKLQVDHPEHYLKAWLARIADETCRVGNVKQHFVPLLSVLHKVRDGVHDLLRVCVNVVQGPPTFSDDRCSGIKNRAPGKKVGLPQPRA